jgi:aminopeptidase-like protein
VSGLKHVVEELYPLHRTLVSEGTDRALELIGLHLPDTAAYRVERFTAGAPAWTWTVPQRWSVHEAYLELETGERVIDFSDSPLHLVSYSEPVDAVLSWQELEPHLHYSAERPHAIPWEFKFYERSWGFCLSKERFDRLPRDARYRVLIRTEFGAGPEDGLAVGCATLNPADGANEQTGELLLCAHVCHPAQANDDASGVATLIGVAQALAARPLQAGSMRVRLLFCPETIGSICYLSHHEELLGSLRGGIFSEMTGNENALILQRSLQDDHVLDRIAADVMARRFGAEFRQGAFRRVISNDEMVINGPGVGAPCISLSRWPYPEYHTSDDNPSIIGEQQLREAAAVIEEITRIFASNYVPRRTFSGPLFLSGLGLWVDWRDDPALNRALETILLSLEGEDSVFDIAGKTGLDYWTTLGYLDRLRERGLVDPVGYAEVG